MARPMTAAPLDPPPDDDPDADRLRDPQAAALEAFAWAFPTPYGQEPDQ